MIAVGKAMPRVDGPLKTTGTADYASDRHFDGLLYAVPVGASVAKGEIESLDVKTAEGMPGVRKVYHRANAPKLYRAAKEGFDVILDESRPAFEDDTVRYHGQYVALVVADTFEQAIAGAHAVKATYRVEKPNVETAMEPEGGPQPEHRRGDAAKAFDAATVKVDHVYTTPRETHSAIELHATVAVPEPDGALTLYETSQAVNTHRNTVAQQLGVGKDKVRVVTKYLGSGFGGKLWPWPFSSLAASVARDLDRPIKLVLTRPQVFQSTGFRPPTQQRVRLSATPDGKLTSIGHDYVTMTSILDDYEEDCGEATSYLYSCPNVRVTKGSARRNVGTPTSMRGPGAVPGLFATETAMDELAIALKINPLQLRVLNEPKIDEGKGIPFSSRHLIECYEVGKKAFGWDRYTPAVGSMRRDGLTLGWGVACCGWIAERFPAEATVELRQDGTARVATGAQDLGTGTYTMVAQIAGERLGLDPARIEPVLGDTDLPPGPISGGSMATASLVPAVFQAADKAVEKLKEIAATAKGTPFEGKKPEELAYTQGMVHLKEADFKGGTPFGAILAKANIRAATGSGKDGGSFGAPPKVSRHSYGVQFVEVAWDYATARLRVPRIVTVIDAGRIVNPKTATNQIAGAAIMGIGMGLFEETLYDERNGAPLNRNFADYVMPVNADAPRVEVHFLDHPDLEINELGLRGVGEIGLAGVAAALSNAVHHATGVRVRELPIKIEDLLTAKM